MLTTIAQAAIAREDYIHPEKLYKDLIFCPSGTQHNEVEKREVKRAGWREADTEEVLCWSCGWRVKD